MCLGTTTLPASHAVRAKASNTEPVCVIVVILLRSFECIDEGIPACRAVEGAEGDDWRRRAERSAIENDVLRKEVCA